MKENNRRFKSSSRNLANENISSNDNLGRMPPQAIDLEECVLGSMLLERSAVMNVIDSIKAEDFYLESHKEIFQAIHDLYRDDKPVDMRTVVAQLRKNGKLEIVGGAYYIAALTSKVSSSANIDYHTKIIIEMSMRRKLIVITSQFHSEAYDETNDIFETLAKYDQQLGDGMNVYLKGNTIDAKTLISNSIQKMMSRNSQNGITGVPSGFKLLDQITGGWQPAELIIIAARPGMGKTALSISCLLNAAVDHNIPVACFSLEMSALSLGDRMVSSTSEITHDAIRKNKIGEHEYMQIMNKTNAVANANIFIDDTSSLHIFELSARAKRLKNEHNIQLIIVDYLQLMKGDQRGNREQEIASISMGLKQLSKELNIPVIALSQLSRGVEQRGGDKRPMLSDLRESGSIEQDADIVIFLYRPAYYGITTDNQGNNVDNVMEVIIAKHRNGSLENIPLKFIGKYIKVTDWDTPVSGNFKRIENVRTPYPDEKTDDLPF